MLKHKKNCTKNEVIIQHRYLEGANNGDRRVVHRLYCHNCKNSHTISLEEAQKLYPHIYAKTKAE